ncbi:RNAse (barnase) inhibitor barstar [Sinorhizobium fredii]
MRDRYRVEFDELWPVAMTDHANPTTAVFPENHFHRKRRYVR